MGGRLAKFRQVARHPVASVQSVEKVLEQKIISPRHPSTVEGYQHLVKENPDLETLSKERNNQLHDMLHSVRVDSTGVPPTDVLKSTRRPLRNLNVVPDGKLSSDKLSELFINRKIAPEEWTDECIADHYKLDLKVAQNLTKYFGSFYIYKKEKDGLVIGDSKKFYQSQDEQPQLK